MRTRILSVTPINPLGVTAPLTSKGSQENGINAITGRRYNPSVSFADSSPCTGEPRRLPPQSTEFAKVRTAVKPAGAGCPHPSRCVAKARTAPPSPRGRLCAPSASLSTAEPRFAPDMPHRSPKQASKSPAEPGFRLSRKSCAAELSRFCE
mgnify:CR=1 FL=1